MFASRSGRLQLVNVVYVDLIVQANETDLMNIGVGSELACLKVAASTCSC